MTHVYNVSLVKVKTIDSNVSILEFVGVVGATSEPRTVMMYILAAELEAMKQQLCDCPDQLVPYEYSGIKRKCDNLEMHLKKANERIARLLEEGA